MSILKVNKLQVGQDGTSTNNYTLYQPASPDGTVRLGYGNAESVTDILTLKNSRLGIGTDNPSAKLQVFSGSGDQLWLDNAGERYTQISLRNNGTQKAAIWLDETNNDLSLYAGSGYGIRFLSNGTEKARLDTNGYLGLNNSAPHNQYYNNFVIGDGSAAGDKGITIRTTSTNEGVIAFSDSDSGAARYAGKIAYNHGSNDMMFFTLNGDERLRIDANGRTLINLTSSLLSYAGLQIKGDVDNGAHICLANKTAAPASGHNIGSIRFTNNAGGFGALIGVEGDGTWSNGSSHPSRMILATTASGSTGTSARLVITSSGTIGLGTVSPASRLHVHAPNTDLATIRLSGTAANQVEYDVRQGIVGVNNAGFSIRDITNSTTRFVISNTGNIGLGIDSPNQKLHVHSSGTSYVRFTDESSGTGANDGVVIGLDHPHTYVWNYEAGDFVVATNAAEKLRVKSDGSAVLGANNLANSWSQFGTNTDGLTIDDVGVTNTGIKLSHGSSNTYLVQAGNNNAYLSHYGSGQMVFGVGSTGQEAFRINASRVARFQNATGDFKIASTTGNDGGKIFLQEINTDAWSLEAQRANGAFYIIDEYNSKERLRIDNTGNTGIGLKLSLRENTSNAFSLQTNGANGYFRLLDDYDGLEIFRIHGDGAYSYNTTNLTNYGQTSSGYSTAGGSTGNWSYRRDTGAVIQATDADSGWSLMYLNKYDWNSGDDSRWIAFYLNGASKDNIYWNGSNIVYGTASDYRIKKNIRDFTGGIDKVKQLKVRLYDYKETERGTDHVGFIAHELQEVVPDAVAGEKDAMREEEDTGNIIPAIQGVEYGKVTPLLTAALQEAIAKIETLEARIAALES